MERADVALATLQSALTKITYLRGEVAEQKFNKCEYCGAPIIGQIGRFKSLKRRFCSIECRNSKTPWDQVFGDGKYILEPPPEQLVVVGHCWIWTGFRDKHDYGMVNLLRKGFSNMAYRAAFQLVKGVIPNNLVIDHLCKRPACINPDHLEPVTQLVNVQRGKAFNKTRCPQGHAYTPENIYTRTGATGTEYKRCRICTLKAVRDRKERLDKNQNEW